MQEDIVHPDLGLLLQPSQRLWVLVAHVAEEGELGAPFQAFIQGGEVKNVTPASLAATVVDCRADRENSKHHAKQLGEKQPETRPKYPMVAESPKTLTHNTCQQTVLAVEMLTR